ncbi:PIG-L deacetylase family protein [Hansschlegelia sp. KR7-227]|jgi:LmbE family N-acetylglucosaminyl deacetylase|uniref:PIG-L deacetylase family protein n=1 Tax=Hansschlegelia sp. KR7-227 TaxID=3400914 RepID=UPI003C12457B
MIAAAEAARGVSAALVVAPHPDDESLGCGGLMAALVRRGARVHVVFVTDGGASHPNSRSWPRERLASHRAEEAREALRRLGADPAQSSFLGLPDAGMPKAGTPEREAALTALTAIVEWLRPDLVLTPWRRDPHRDHRDSWALARDALQAAGQEPKILEYAVWLDEIGAPEDRPRTGEAERVEIDVSETRAAKRAAVEAHRTQIEGVIRDDPDAFQLSPHTIERLTGACEVYWRPCAAT